MKRLALTFVFVITAILSGLAQYQVNLLSADGETMTFRAVGYGKNAKVATHDAELGVIKTLMFYGVPNSQQTVPMVSVTEQEAYKSNSKFLDSFYEGGYQNVITRSVIVRKFQKDESKQKNIVLDVQVNVRALRTELERNGIIRKFGL